jgi:hypothetical protein
MADASSRLERTRIGATARYTMLWLLVLGVAVGFAAAYYFRGKETQEISKLFAGAAVTLLYASLLGGVVTQLWADFDRRRVQRAAEVDFISNVLADLKGVHDQVDRGRMVIKAHRSAKTYGDEMRGFMNARVKLQNVERALRTDERRMPILTARDEVIRMSDYLRALLEEFEEEYKGSVYSAKCVRGAAEASFGAGATARAKH